MSEKREKKYNFIKKIYEYFSTYKSIILVTLENVTSNQVQLIRKDLLALDAHLVIGKNTVIKKALDYRLAELDKNMEDYEFFAQFGAPMTDLKILREQLVGKFGMIFSNKSVFDLKSIILGNRRKANAKAGAVSTCDVIIPPGSTGMDPSQIGFFHALQITTKINKGMIEIQKDVHVLKVGQIVGPSEATLLARMNITPFEYGMEVISVYDDGAILPKTILEFSPEAIVKKFQAAASNLTAVSLETGYMIPAAVPHMVVNAFKNLAGIAMETGYKMDALEAALNAGPAKGGATENKVVETKVEQQVEEEEEEDIDMGGLFD